MILMICSLLAPMAVGQSNNTEVLTIKENVSIEKDGSENYSTSLFQNDGETVLRLRSIDDASGCWVDGIEKHTWAVGENCNEALSPKQFEEEPPIIVGPCIEENVAGIIEYSTERDCGTQVIIPFILTLQIILQTSYGFPDQVMERKTLDVGFIHTT